MDRYFVEHTEADQDDQTLYTFMCEAGDPDHAERQCKAAHPGCNVTRVYLASSVF